jgi:16S rRNA (uracil1498-N3)-methyltransferase
VIFWEDEARGVGEVLRAQKDRPAAVSIFTGPEGGFSEAEVALARGAGLIAAGLGRRILRAQTAPLVAAAIVQYEWGDL